MNITEKLKNEIRDVLNFPIEGIVFKDITPIMMNPNLSKEVIEELKIQVEKLGITKIAGIESRGFLFGYPLAMALGLPFVLIRKKGKLPYHKVSHAYSLEYGTAEIEMHSDAVEKGDKILIHDDLLATGGSAAAAGELVLSCGGEVAAFSFIVTLDFLNGEQKLSKFSNNILTLVRY
jgi:adenine phosphoribosyltransferase